MFISIFVILSILTAVAYTSSLIERKIYDPYIVCHNPPPPVYALPAGYLAQDYRTSMDLCSAANGQRNNVGCFCSSSRSDLHCGEDLGDPILAKATTDWFDRTNDHTATLQEFCDIACYCSDPISAGLARSSMQRNSPLNRILNHNNTQTFIGRIGESDTEMASNSHCGNTCMNQADCAGGHDGCTCKTQSEQYVPGKGMVMFAAACMISLGGKREEQSPCPCNSTYVSQSCCDATDGIVQEPGHLKLGEVLNSNDL